MQKLKSKEFWFSLFYFLLGVLGIAILVKHIAEWTGEGEIWLTDPNSIYATREIPSRWTNVVFFTNITCFIFCVHAILYFISVLFNIEKLKNFLKNPYVLLFIAINQFLVFLVYTLMIIIFGVNVSREVLAVPGNMHNFATSIFKHYFLTAAAIVYAFLIKPRRKVKFKWALLILIYPVVYAIITKIVGMTCFVFEWYPYPFFGPRHLWFNLFGNFDAYSKTKALLIIAACLIVIAAFYVLFIYLACLIYNKIVARDEKRQNAAEKAQI